MTASARVIKNSTILSALVLLERAIAFFLPWYVARVQGKSVWGEYSTAMSFVLVGVSLGYWGLAQYLPREVARNREGARAYLFAGMRVAFLASLVMTLAVAAIVFVLDYPPETRNLILLGVILLVLPNAESLVAESVIYGLERMDWVAFVRFPLTIVRTAVAIFFLQQGAPISVLFPILAIYYALTILGYVYIVGAKYESPTVGATLPKQSLSTMSLAQAAIPFFLITLVGETFRQVDRIFISKLWDTDWVGVYATGIMLVQVGQMLPPAIMNAIFPGLSRAYTDPGRFQKLSLRLFKLLLLGMFPPVLAAFALSKPLILRLFGNEYTDSVPVMAIAVWSLLPILATRLLFRILLASNQERLAIPVAVVRSTITVLLNLWLIPRQGVVGAAVVLVVVELAALILNLSFVHSRVFRFQFWQNLWLPCLCMAVSVAVFVLLPNAWIGLPVALVIFGGSLLLSRTLSLDDWHFLRGEIVG